MNKRTNETTDLTPFETLVTGFMDQFGTSKAGWVIVAAYVVMAVVIPLTA